MRYRGRCAHAIENSQLRVTVLQEGGHIAEILHKGSGVNPLWLPPWRTMEPAHYDPAKHPEYGNSAESKLLSGIMGHNVCVDLFGDPSPEEARAGISTHGEASIAHYEVKASGESLTQCCLLEEAGLWFGRSIELNDGIVVIKETVKNKRSLDRPIAWTQHVTLGPPFLEYEATQFRTSVTKSYCPQTGASFSWPMAPAGESGDVDLSVYCEREGSRRATTHLMDQKRDWAFFFAYSPQTRLLFGYAWRPSDFPWLAIWDENRSVCAPPWNGSTITRGMEFGVSPVAESRRQMIERHELFGEPCFRWLPARSTLTAEYYAFARSIPSMPADLEELELQLPPRANRSATGDAFER